MVKNMAKNDMGTLREFRDIITPILEAVRRYEWDMEMERSGYAISGLLDFSDLYRYLHPILDLTAYQDTERFYPEQIALHYLLTKDTLPLYLLPGYIEEYRLSLRSSQVQLAEFGKLPEDRIKRRVIRMDKKLKPLLEELQSVDDAGRIQRLGQIHGANQNLLDILFDNVRTKILQRGTKTYKDLLERKRVQPASKIPGLDPSDLTFQSSDDYERIRLRLEAMRPGRHRANDTDARAFHIIQCLNSKYFGRKKVFLFITSSRRVIDAFDSEYAIQLHGDRDLFEKMGRMSVVRTPEYLILRFLLTTSAKLRKEMEHGRFSDLIARYVKIVHRLEVYFGEHFFPMDLAEEGITKEHSEAFQIRAELLPLVALLTEFRIGSQLDRSLRTSIRSRLGMESLLVDNDISEDEIRKKIDSAISNPKILIRPFEQNARKLSSSIGDLEQHMLSLVYQEGDTSLVYDVHVAETSDEDIKKAATSIVGFLADQKRSSFSKAFAELGALRLSYPTSPDTYVLTAKVYRAMRSYREALEHARRAVRTAPTYSEAHIELGFCYRFVGQQENSPSMLTQAWDCFKKAEELRVDARVLREKAFLVWLSMEVHPDLSFEEEIGDPLEYIVKTSDRALKMAIDETGEQSRLSTTIKNDEAYYLALRGKEDDLRKALELVESALSFHSKVLSKKSLGAFKDTKGYILVLLIEKGYCQADEVPQLLREAAELTLDAYRVRPESSVTHKHLAKCLDMALSICLERPG